MTKASRGARAARADGVLHVGGRRAAWWREGALDGRPLVLLAHGAGAPADSPFMEVTAAGLLARGLAVARFHFPYMQRRVEEGTRRPPDPMPVLQATWCALGDEVATWRGAGPVVLAGKSMGGRVASLVLAEGRLGSARGLVHLGYPLHPAGRPEALRREHLPAVPVPQLFVSGTRDALARWDLLEGVVASLGPRARLHPVDGADHSLARRRSAPLEGADAWLDVVAAFVDEVVAP